MHITCPTCSAAYDLGPEAYGRKVQCTCGQRFFVEAPAKPDMSKESIATKTEPEAKKRSFKTTKSNTPQTATVAKAATPKKSKKSLAVAALLILLGAGGYLYWEKIAKAQPAATTEQSTVAAAPAPAPPKIKTSDTPVGTQYISEAQQLTQSAASEFKSSDWKRKYAGKSSFKYEAWPKPYGGGPGFSWWEPKEADCANRWYLYLGPLGVQARSLNATFQRYAGFNDTIPEELKDTDGRLLQSALLVTKVFEDSPAAGHLEVGDLILGIENEALLDSMLVDPTITYKTKSARNLGLHAGWLVDHAEGRGLIDIDVLRGVNEYTYTSQAQATATSATSTTDFDVDVSGARFLKLFGTGADDATDYTSFNWIEPKLSGPGKKDLDLSTTNWLSGTCGWRSIQRGLNVSKKPVELDGEEIKSVIGTHGASEIVFLIPPGYTTFTAKLHKASRRDISGTISTAPEKFANRIARSYRELFRQEVTQGGDFNAGPKLRDSTRDAKFNVALGDAKAVVLEVNGDPSHHSGWSTWIKPELRGVGRQPIDLSTAEWLSATTGWGKIRRGTDLNGELVLVDGKPMPNVIGTHANSQITFAVPDGYTHLISRFQLGSSRGRIIPGIRLKNGPDLALDVDVSSMDRVRITCKNAPTKLTNLRLEGPTGVVTGFSVISEQRSKLHGSTLLELKANTRSHAEFVIQVPPGTWHLKADVNLGNKSAEIAVETLQKAPLPDYLSAHRKAVSFPIQKIGSFKEGFPGDHCAKTKTVNDITEAWILAQQQDNGSWPRRAGYCSPAMDTSLCVLALLSADKPQYDAAIRRGVEYLINECPYSDWACPNALGLIAICEYYLRTEAEWVLPGIERQSERCRKFVYGDFTCGHGANPGYGDGGVNYGGAHLALGFALAAKTPAGANQKLLDGLMWRVQSLAPGGYVPYTRHNRNTFSDPPSKSYAAGARTGIYLTAAQLYGGPNHFIEHAIRHLGDRTLGGGDQGHASKIFSFMGSTIGLASSDQALLHEHAKRYGWALTLTRRFDGGFVWNSERLEYMGAEPVMNILYRTASYMLLLNADKQNLAITGKRNFRSTNSLELPKLTDADRRIWHYYSSNWRVVRTILGVEAPPALTAGSKALDNLERTAGENMLPRLFEIVEKNAESIVSAIHNSSVTATDKALLTELILGIDFRVDVSTEKDNPKKGKVALSIQYPLAGKFMAADKARIAAHAKQQTFPLSGSITLTDPSATFLKDTVTLTTPDATKVNWQKSVVTQSIPFELTDDDAPELKAEVAYSFMGRSVSLGRTISVPHARTNNRIVRIPGTMSRDHLRHSVSLTLPDGSPLECVNVSFEGKSDIQFPISYKGIATFSDTRPAFPLITGSTGTFGYQSDINRVVPAAATDAQIITAPIIDNVKISSTTTPVEDTDAILDWNLETAFKFRLPASGTTTISCSFQEPEDLGKFFMAIKGRYSCNVTALVNAKWIRIYGAESRNTLQPLIPCRASELRIEIKGKPKAKLELQELHWYRAPNRGAPVSAGL